MSGLTGAWRGATALAAPALRRHLRRRAARGKEDAARLTEREGFGAARPPGTLLWLHAASVGETLAALPLLEAVAARSDARFLVTTGTVTSAAVLAQRLPAALRDRVAHRFVPLDVPGWVGRFLAGWRPDLGVLVEQELWPNLLLGARARGVPLVLVNARLSERSARRWRWAPGTTRVLLGCFARVLARSPADAARLAGLGAAAEPWGDLKLAAPALPCDAAELTRLREAGGPVWLAASTHPGEEEQVLAAHLALRLARPALRLVLVPRHPERGATVAGLAAAAGLAATRRAAGGDWPPPGGVLVADTLGELGLWYRLVAAALVGGSLVPAGGHNPLEPARLGCPILLGPHTENFSESATALLAVGGARRVTDAMALAEAVTDVFDDPETAAAMAAAARGVAADATDLLGRTADLLLAVARRPGAPG